MRDRSTAAPRRPKATGLREAAGLVSVLLVLSSACVSLRPPLPAPEPELRAQWPLEENTAESTDERQGAPGADIGWRGFFADPKLEALLALALENNRDLRAAILNVERTRARYGIQRADRLPSVSASGNVTVGTTPIAAFSPTYGVNLGVAGFELDLFGRVHDLADAALERYLAQEEVRRSAQLGLIAEVAGAYLGLAADRELLRLARSTLESHEASYALTKKRHELGALSGLDLSQARALVELARADIARYAGQASRSLHALELLVGAPIDPELLPGSFDLEDASPRGLPALPGGLPSEVLLRRPDVLAAEHHLRAANAHIGAARAAFFPSITLTAGAGVASDSLAGLFSGDAFAWSFTPSINLPIFQGGRLRANLELAEADQQLALTRYEHAIQVGFREVADALALSPLLAQQREAQQALVEAAERSDALSRLRYEAGRDSYLVRLDAQRTLYSAQQALITTRLGEQLNRITLYRVLGGGWKE